MWLNYNTCDMQFSKKYFASMLQLNMYVEAAWDWLFYCSPSLWYTPSHPPCKTQTTHLYVDDHIMVWYWRSRFRMLWLQMIFSFQMNPAQAHNFRTYDGSGELCLPLPRGGSWGQVANGWEYRLPPRKFKGGRCPIVLLSCPSAICTFVRSQQSRAVVRPALLPPPDATFALVQQSLPVEHYLSHCRTTAL